MPCEGCEFPAITGLVEGEEDDTQLGFVAESVEQRLKRMDIVRLSGYVCPHVPAETLKQSLVMVSKDPGWICITNPSSRLILAISVSICPRNISAFFPLNPFFKPLNRGFRILQVQDSQSRHWDAHGPWKLLPST